MAEARGEHAHRRTASRVHTEPIINTNQRQRGGVATPDPTADEEASSLRPSEQLQPSQGHSASASSRGRHSQPSPQAALLMAQELLRYRPTEAGHDGWLARITELVNVAGAAPAPSRSMAPPPPPPSAHAGHGAPPPPPPPGDGAGHHRGARAPGGAPPPSHGASSPHLAGTSCQIVQRAREDARVSLERQRDRQRRAVQHIATAGRTNRDNTATGVVTSSKGCLALTRELRQVAWPTKFKPELPPRYEGTANPVEFLQLYTVGVEAAGGDDTVMANWFPK